MPPQGPTPHPEIQPTFTKCGCNERCNAAWRATRRQWKVILRGSSRISDELWFSVNFQPIRGLCTLIVGDVQRNFGSWQLQKNKPKTEKSRCRRPHSRRAAYPCDSRRLQSSSPVHFMVGTAIVLVFLLLLIRCPLERHHWSVSRNRRESGKKPIIWRQTVDVNRTEGLRLEY